MTLLRQVIDEHCKRTGREKHADNLEAAVTFARDNWPSRSDNATVRSLLSTFFRRCNERPKP